MRGETLTEVKEGRLTEPIDLTQAMINAIPLTPSYAIYEVCANRPPKFRLGDEFRAPEINAIVETDDANEPGNLGVFVAIASYYKISAPGRRLMRATLNFAHA